MGSVRVTVDLAGADLETLLEFASLLSRRYCERDGPLGVKGDEPFGSPVQRPGESVRDFAARVRSIGLDPMRIPLRACARESRYLDIDFVEGIVASTDDSDADFLEEVAGLWRSHAGRPARAKYKGEIETLEWEKRPPALHRLPRRPASLHRALHFLLGFEFEGSTPSPSLTAFLNDPAAELRLDARDPDEPTRCCVRCRVHHRDGLCDRLLAAPLARLDWLRASGDQGEYARFSFVDVQVEALNLELLRAGLARWRQIEADPVFERFAASHPAPGLR